MLRLRSNDGTMGGSPPSKISNVSTRQAPDRGRYDTDTNVSVLPEGWIRS